MSHHDKRYSYIRGLWERAQVFRLAQYREKEWQFACQVIARLGTEEEALPSYHAVRKRVPHFGKVGEEWLKDIEASRVTNIPAASGMYCSASAALLVALLEFTEQSERKGRSCLCPKGWLIEAAGAICEQHFRPLEQHLEAQSNGVKLWCTAWQQMMTLQTLGFVKQRERKQLCRSGIVFELTDSGRERAVALRLTGEAREALPLRHARRPLTTERGVVMLRVRCACPPSAPRPIPQPVLSKASDGNTQVDEREGGGMAHELFSQLCDSLERQGARFETRRLPAGSADYQFVIMNEEGGERVLPHIIERKAVADVAASILDGRWERQKAAMRAKSLQSFEGHAVLEYLIEGTLDAQLHCCSLCEHFCRRDRGIGGCTIKGHPSLEQVERALQALGEDGFVLTTTANVSQTANHLCQLQRRLQQEVDTKQSQADAAAETTNAPSSLVTSHRRETGPATAAALDREQGVTSAGSRRIDDFFSSQRPPSTSATTTLSQPQAEKKSRTCVPTSRKTSEKPPRRPTGHKAQPPSRPDEVSKADPFPRPRSCNYAFLVVMDREFARRVQAGTATSDATLQFRKEDLLAMAADKTEGDLCTVDPYEGRAVAATQRGAFEYTGWAGVHKQLIKRELPWKPLIAEHTVRKPGQTGHTFSLTDAGRVAARRLHMEAELSGYCTCGLVPKANFAPVEKGADNKRELMLGLREDRFSVLQQIINEEGWRKREAWERACIEWEREEKKFLEHLNRSSALTAKCTGSESTHVEQVADRTGSAGSSHPALVEEGCSSATIKASNELLLVEPSSHKSTSQAVLTAQPRPQRSIESNPPCRSNGSRQTTLRFVVERPAKPQAAAALGRQVVNLVDSDDESASENHTIQLKQSAKLNFARCSTQVADDISPRVHENGQHCQTSHPSKARSEKLHVVNECLDLDAAASKVLNEAACGSGTELNTRDLDGSTPMVGNDTSFEECTKRDVAADCPEEGECATTAEVGGESRYGPLDTPTRPTDRNGPQASPMSTSTSRPASLQKPEVVLISPSSEACSTPASLPVDATKRRWRKESPKA